MLNKFLNLSTVAIQSFLNVLMDLALSESQNLYCVDQLCGAGIPEATGREVIRTVL